MFKSPQTESDNKNLSSIIDYYISQELKYFRIKILGIILFTCLHFSVVSQVCGTNSGPPQRSFDFSNLKFFQEANCEEQLLVKCNFIILTRDNGTGGMSSEVANAFKWNPNLWWEQITDATNCELGSNHPSDANVRLEVLDIIEEPNTAAWDYNAAAKNYDQDPTTGPYWQDAFIPRRVASGNFWPALDAVARKYKSLYPDRINVFFVENGEQLAYYEEYMANGNPIPETWAAHDTNPLYSQIYSGASFFPSSYYDNRDWEYIIMGNIWTEYLGLLEFGEIEQPDNSESNLTKALDFRWNKAGLLNHEFGHSFGLIHSCCCLKSRMASSDPLGNCGGCAFEGARSFLSLDYLEEIHNTLATRSVQRYVNCDVLNEDNCIINTIGNEIVTEPMNIYGDLIVKSGHTLTLKDEVFLAEESSIDIEPGGRLIVDGGILTTLCEFETWKGIRVAGGNTDFDVMTMNGAVIENTSAPAISMFPPNIPWPEVQQFGNGILLADNTTFNNCQRMLELIAYSPSINNSKITNCHQFGGKWGITNWHCEGVQVDNCDFNDIENHCLGAYDGTYIATNNDFFGGTEEVLFTNTKSGKESTIFNNNFHTAPIGLRAVGTHTGFLDIIENDFYNSLHGIAMEKLNNYEITFNTFSGPGFGAYCEQNGVDLINKIDNNTFDGNTRGIVSFVDNDKLTFTRNCFDSQIVDIDVYGLVGRQIGSFGSPAANCFTHKGASSSPVVDLGGFPEPRPALEAIYGDGTSFLYYEPNDAITNCIDAVNAIDNVEVLPGSLIPIQDFCLTEMPNPEDPDTPCNPDNTEDDLSQAITNLNQEINFIRESDLNPAQEAIELFEPERCLTKIKSRLYSLYLEVGDYVQAESVFTPAQSFNDHITIFSIKLIENNPIAAREYLSELVPSNNKQQDFIAIQEINIDRLENGPNYLPSENQLANLWEISEKEHSYAGFAKSLYFQLTGILAPLDINLPDFAPIENRSFQSAKLLGTSLSVFPNPFKDVLEVEVDEFVDLRVKIINLSGGIMYKSNIKNSKTLIKTVSWGQGVYFLQIVNNKDEIVRQEKLVLLR